MELLNKLFRLKERGTSLRTEILAGVTTFMAMSYIIFVQPVILGIAGMPKGGVFFATCVASAFACLLMGLLANYPIALAPAMGHNAFFAIIVCGAAAQGGMGFSWDQALAAVFIGGAVFTVLSFFGVRAAIMQFIPNTLKRAIAGGIGLLITLIGLEYAGLVVNHSQTLVTFGDLHNRHVLLAVFGLTVTLILLAREVRGALLYGIGATALLGSLLTALGFPMLKFELQTYGSLNPADTILKLDFGGLFSQKGFIGVILTFLFLDVFDTVGTLVGVSERAGLLDENGKLPRARWALFSDATGTVVGSLLGTSTITSYVESAAGVQAGGKTGLANVVTAALFIISLVLYPILGVVSSGVGPQHSLYPVIAPALIVVGAMMLKSMAGIAWEDPTELLPAFLTLIIIPLAVSITEGIAIGFIAYSVLKFATGRWREVHWGFHVVSAALLLRYIFLT